MSPNDFTRIAPLVCDGPPQDDLDALDWSWDGRRLVGGTRRGDLLVWDARSGELRQVIACGAPITDLRRSPEGLVVERKGRDRERLSWAIAHDGILVDLAWAPAPEAPPRVNDLPAALPDDDGGWLLAPQGGRVAARRWGRVEVWALPATDGWWLGYLRNISEPDRPGMVSLDEEALLRDEVTACHARKDFRRGIAVTSRLLLLGREPRGLNHVARGLFCQLVGDARGEYFELWEAERRRPTDPLLGTEDVVQWYGPNTRLLDLMFDMGGRDADDWRLLNLASRPYNVAFTMMQAQQDRAALPLLVDSLAIRPQAMVWFYTARLLLMRGEVWLADWCLGHLDGAPADELEFLYAGVSRSVVDEVRAAARQFAATLGPPR
jgi:hypothetical protein